MFTIWNNFSQQIKPRYQEVSAYLIAFTFCWVFVSHADFRQGTLMFFSGLGSYSPWFLALGLIVMAGLFLSLLNAFIKRKKLPLERAVMAWFATGVSGVASFFVGAEMLHSRSSFTLALAAWNIVMSVLILIQMGMQRYDMDDEDASFVQVVVTTAVLVAVLWLADNYLRLSWALTLSIGIFYATSVIFLAAWVLNRLGFHLGDMWK